MEPEIDATHPAIQIAASRIICPNCDAAVRAVDETPCPNCRGCPSCGRKLARGEAWCGCGFSDDSARVARLIELFGVTDEQAEIASRRFTIRKTRERNAVILAAVVAPILMLSGAVLGDILDPQSFLDYVVYCLSILAISAPCAYALRRWLNGKENRLFQEELKGPEH